MPFRLVYYSQQDPRWKNDRLGFGQSEKETIGYIGCALTSVSMMLSGHGFTETPQTLNKKLQNAKGFVGSGNWFRRWSLAVLCSPAYTGAPRNFVNRNSVCSWQSRKPPKAQRE